MSYDVSLRATIDLGGPSFLFHAFDWNYTSNCAPMWRAAGCDIAEFHTRSAYHLGAAISTALYNLCSEPERYRAMNPPNGCGDYDSVRVALWELGVACAQYPRAIVLVDH